MSYLPYLVGAYAVFVLVLGWDFLAGRRQVRRALLAARQRARRPRGRPAAPADSELVR
ncbi:heme exporter protein CcmD [Xanthomonas massiliensis]|jgi:heme exporter protein D|uniref:heme exporter protein CcmD n=1 Tax=Xanthomonas massiliensis TaxID=1720302 RepID=UPI00098F92A6|nr:heme exporter protein CcmD [Xanthomonas massiliensis]